MVDDTKLLTEGSNPQKSFSGDSGHPLDYVKIFLPLHHMVISLTHPVLFRSKPSKGASSIVFPSKKPA
jgi:hypothetical protein